MKLLFHPDCGDLRRIHDGLTETTCLCGFVKASRNPHTDIVSISPGGMVIGIPDAQFQRAVDNQPDEGRGVLFPTFLLPKKTKTVIVTQ